MTQCRMQVVLNLLEQNEVKISEDDFSAVIREESAKEGLRPDEYRSKVISEGRLGEIQALAIKRKVLRTLLQKIDSK